MFLTWLGRRRNIYIRTVRPIFHLQERDVYGSINEDYFVGDTLTVIR